FTAYYGGKNSGTATKGRGKDRVRRRDGINTKNATTTGGNKGREVDHRSVKAEAQRGRGRQGNGRGGRRAPKREWYGEAVGIAQSRQGRAEGSAFPKSSSSSSSSSEWSLSSDSSDADGEAATERWKKGNATGAVKTEEDQWSEEIFEDYDDDITSESDPDAGVFYNRTCAEVSDNPEFTRIQRDQ
ncbi:unnamed protein product, partial [Amoebophrya sp. A25]